MITNPSSREWFQSVAGRVSEWQSIVSQPLFQVAIDCALIQMQEQLQTGLEDGNFNKAASNFMRLAGARDFAFILRNIGEPVPEKKMRTVNTNLELRKE